MRLFISTLLFFSLPLVAQPSKKVVIAGDVIGPGNSPMAGVLVAAIPARNDWRFQNQIPPHVLSTPGGHFRLLVDPGSYGLTASYPKLKAAFLKGLSVQPGGALQNLKLKMENGGQAISGSVTGPTGQPLSGGFVSVRTLSFSDGCEFISPIKRGHFEITVGPGSYLLQAKSSDWYSQILQERVGFQMNGEHSGLFIRAERRPREAPPKVKTWIKRHAIPLSTVDPGTGFADMQPLRTLVGSARVVSIGEATHGTHEFFQFKRRMLEFLVEEMGFRVFAIEANQPEARAVNAYVLRGEGDPVKALKGLYFWTWDTEEILGMIHWMRHYNLDPRHAEKLKFYGFDMQVPDVAWRNIKSYLDRVDPSESSWMDSTMKELGLEKSQGDRARLALPADKKAALLDAADALVKRFDQHREAYLEAYRKPHWWSTVRPGGGQAFADARHDAVVLAQSIEMEFNPRGTGRTRDQSMAENVQWILAQEPEAKAVLWAHNAHVSQFPSDLANTDASMGAYLRKALGASMVTIGSCFEEGGFRAIDDDSGRLVSFSVKPSTEATFTQAMNSTGYPYLVLDLRAVPHNGQVGDWFSGPQKLRQLGAVFYPKQEYRSIVDCQVTLNYDAIFFVRDTTPSHGLPRTVPR